MTAKAMHDSLVAVELMLEDFMDEELASLQMTDAIKQHMQAALQHVATARKMHALSMMPKPTDKKLQAEEMAQIAKTLSRQERWVIRHLGKRDAVTSAVLGSESSRIKEMGFVRENEGVTSLTDKGRLLDKVLVAAPAATH